MDYHEDDDQAEPANFDEMNEENSEASDESEEEDKEDNILYKAKLLFKELAKPLSLTRIEKQIKDEETKKERELARKREIERKRRERELLEAAAAAEIKGEEEIISIQEGVDKKKSEESVEESEEESEEEELMDFDAAEPPPPAPVEEDFGVEAFAEIIVEKQFIEPEVEKFEEYEFSAAPIIDDLIESSLRQAEGEAKRAFLLGKMDRFKLVNRFLYLHNEMNTEQHKNQFLNRNIMDHYRKKRNTRALASDDHRKMRENILKYHQHLSNLDDLLNREIKILEEKNDFVKDLRSKQEGIESLISDNVANLKKVILEGGQLCFNEKTGQYLSEEFIIQNTTKILKTWNEISRIRLDTIYAHHRSGTYNEAVESLEDIGNGLKVTTYEALRAGAEKVAHMVEDRCTDIFQTKLVCNNSTQLMAHMREKTDILQVTIAERKSRYKDARNKNKTIRTQLIELQRERNILRNRYRALNWKAGLKDKPVLLHDYDRTVRRVSKVSASVAKLEGEKKSIEYEIKRLTAKYLTNVKK